MADNDPDIPKEADPRSVDRACTGQISGFAVAADGGLSALPGSPYPVTATDTVFAAGLVGSEQYLFAAGAQSFFGFSVGTDGSLTALSGTPFPYPGGASGGVSQMFADAALDALYFPESALGDVAVFSVDGTGAPTQTDVLAQAGTADELGLTPDGNTLFVSGQTDSPSFDTWMLDGNGVPGTPTGDYIYGGQTISAMAATVDGKFLFLVDQGDPTVSRGSVTAWQLPDLPQPAPNSTAFRTAISSDTGACGIVTSE
jgi:hypothetical protein